VTITTVGYGDITPHTPLGRILASILILIGYSIIAIPTGLITTHMTSAFQNRRLSASVRIVSITFMKKTLAFATPAAANCLNKKACLVNSAGFSFIKSYSRHRIWHSLWSFSRHSSTRAKISLISPPSYRPDQSPLRRRSPGSNRHALPSRRRVEQLGAAAFFKLQVKQNDIRRIEVVDRQFEENVVSLLKRFVFGQAIV
jgi:hypothetical protein